MFSPIARLQLAYLSGFMALVHLAGGHGTGFALRPAMASPVRKHGIQGPAGETRLGAMLQGRGT